MSSIPVLLDVDTGVDDAFAIALAASTPYIKLLCITTCFGNGTLEQSSLNTLKIAELLKLDVPVAAGARKGIISPLRRGLGREAHGDDGLAGRAGKLPYPRRSLLDMGAVELMAGMIGSCPDNVIIASTGPLTNIATLLLAHPELHDRIDGIAISGGAVFGGNLLPTAEGNFAADPEAAQIVLTSGVKVLMCGLDATEKAYATFEDRERLRLAGTRASDFLCDTLREYAEYYENTMLMDGCPIPDAVPIAWIINPSIIKGTPYYVEVDLNGKYTRGSTIADTLGVRDRRPNVIAATDIDRRAYLKMLFDALTYYTDR